MTGPHLVARSGVPGTRGKAGAATGGPPAGPGGAPDRAHPAGAPVPGYRGRLAQLPGLLRRHWLVAVLLTAGLVLRLLATAAYQPALIYVDTLKYLYGASPGSDPVGYTYILRAILAVGNLTTVVVVQHLVGLAMAAALYAVLLRRGLNRWLAALAVGPVLLDAYQVQIEQMIMPDLWFEALVVAGLVVLLWRPAPPLRLAAAAGVLLGASATVHQLGEVLVLPALVYALATAETLRRALTTAGVLLVAFLVPIVTYCSVSYASNGHFRLARGQQDTGRVVAAADCATLRLPAAVRPFCPTPRQQAFGPDWIEHSKYSPLHTAPVPAGMTRAALTRQLTAAIWSQQPQRIAGAVAVQLAAAVRGDPDLGSIHRAAVALAVPDALPGLPELGHAGPGQHDHRGCAGEAVRQAVPQAAQAGLRRPGPGEPAHRRLPAVLPAGRRVHPGSAVRRAGPARRGRLGDRAGPAVVG